MNEPTTVDPKNKTNHQMILDHLNTIDPNTGRRRGLSTMDAIGLYRIQQLAARVHELRKKGHCIQSIRRVDSLGAPYVEYFLHG